VRPDVQDAVAKLCCSWWTAEADNREFLVSQALPYLLVRPWGGGCWRSFCLVGLSKSQYSIKVLPQL
jgi:hypothetical protein